MKRNYLDLSIFDKMWKVKEGSKVIWKVQCPKGILSFTRKKDARRWLEATYNVYGREE